jgi:hypothetical protein
MCVACDDESIQYPVSCILIQLVMMNDDDKSIHLKKSYVQCGVPVQCTYATYGRCVCTPSVSIEIAGRQQTPACDEIILTMDNGQIMRTKRREPPTFLPSHRIRGVMAIIVST